MFHIFPVDGQDDDEIVGFTAWPSQDRDYVEDDLVLFENADINIGGHFQNSIFVCPYNGTYRFGVHILTQESTGINIKMMQNEERFAGVTTEAIAGVSISGGNIAFTKCVVGDKIWVKVIEAGSLSGNSRATLFTGHLLYRLDQ